MSVGVATGFFFVGYMNIRTIYSSIRTGYRDIYLNSFKTLKMIF